VDFFSCLYALNEIISQQETWSCACFFFNLIPTMLCWVILCNIQVMLVALTIDRRGKKDRNNFDKPFELCCVVDYFAVPVYPVNLLSKKDVSTQSKKNWPHLVRDLENHRIFASIIWTSAFEDIPSSPDYNVFYGHWTRHMDSPLQF